MNKILRMLAVLVLSATTHFASADPVTYGFTVTATGGPLAGATSTGHFTLDSSIFPAGDGTLEVAGLFSDLAFTWDGIAYDETTANTGFIHYFANGTFLATFGTHCSGFGCAVGVDGVSSWAVHGTNFYYGMADTPAGVFNSFDGTVTITGPLQVPEPSTVALLLVGFAGLGFVARRKRA